MQKISHFFWEGYDKSVLVIASLDEMCITALLNRQAEAVIAEAYPGVFILRLS